MPPKTRTHTKRRRTSQSLSIDKNGGHEQESLAAKASTIVQDLVTAGHSLAAIVAAFVQAVPPAAFKEAGFVVQSPQARLAAQRAQQASDYWLLCPQEVRDEYLKHAGPLTRFLHGRLDVAKMDDAAKRALWIDGFKQDWQGDLFLLPDVELRVEDVEHVKTIGMYQRLCERSSDEAIRYVPLQQMWVDATPTVSLVELGKLALDGNCLEFLEHLLDKKLVTIKELESHLDDDSETGGHTYVSTAVEVAACCGWLEMVQYLLSRDDVVCTPNVMDFAAESGNLELVQWLHSNRTEGCTTRAMDWAALSGHLHVLQWLHANRTEGCTDNAMDNAAWRGDLHVIQWLHSNRTEGCTTYAIGSAAQEGHLHVIQWLLANRSEGFTADAILDAQTDEIAVLLIRSLTPEQRAEMLDEVAQHPSTEDQDLVARRLALFGQVSA